MKIPYRFAIFSFSLFLLFSGCQLRERDAENNSGEDQESGDVSDNSGENGNENSGNGDKISLPSSISLGSILSISRAGSTSSEPESIAQIKSEILKEATLNIPEEHATFEFRLNPLLSKYLIAVGDSRDFNIYQPFQGIFLSDTNGENLIPIKTLPQNEDPSEPNNIFSPVFSADLQSEVGWFEINREEEEFITRIHVYSISSGDEFSYRIQNPSAIVDNGSLALFRDEIIMRSDRISDPFRNTVFTHAQRVNIGSDIPLSPIPHTFNQDIFEQVFGGEESIEDFDFLGVVSSSRIAGRERVYYAISHIDPVDGGRHLKFLEQSSPNSVTVVTSQRIDGGVSFIRNLPMIDFKVPYIASLDGEKTLFVANMQSGVIEEISPVDISSARLNPFWST